jgi:hypothetical protein
VSTKSTLLIQINRQSRQWATHRVTSFPADLVRIVRTNLQRTIPKSAPGRHPTRQRLVNSPGRGTHRSRNRTGRTLVRIVRLVRVFSGRPLSRIPRLSRIFSGQPLHASPAALSTPPGRTGGTFSAFSALFLAQTPLRGGSARTSLDSARYKPDLSAFRKQGAWRPCQRVIHGIASLPADLVSLVSLIRTFLQRTLHQTVPGQAFHPSPAALSTSSGPTPGAFCAFCALFFAPAPPSAGPARTSEDSARTSLDSAKNRPDLGTFRKQKAKRHCRSSRITHAACRNPANRRKWMP